MKSFIKSLENKQNNNMEKVEEKNLSRRVFLGKSAFVGSLGGFFLQTFSQAAICKLTTAQGEGPFYPEKDLERDADLTRHTERDPIAKGEQIFLSGTVTDEACKPIVGALVEIWQACFSGRYNHSEDKNPLELDPNFQYWGRTRTNGEGKYLFKTIIPGHYPVSSTRYRPPHIHFKIHAPKFVTLTTQSYFDPKSYENIETAKIVKKWNDHERVPASLIVHYKKEEATQKLKSGRFDITLHRIQTTQSHISI